MKSKKGIITDSYAYINKPGEDEAFRKMIKVAELGGSDILYVDSVKEFAGRSLADFKEALTAIEQAGMLVVSLTESEYDYKAFMTAIEVLEDLTPGYVKYRCGISAVTMFRMGADIQQICEDTGLSEADVYEFIAEYKRSIEEMETRLTE